MRVFGAAGEQYADFAEYAAGESPCLEDWSRGVAGDEQVVAWLETLPEPKRQPNLVFAAARWHGVPAPGPFEGLRQALLEDDGTIRHTILTRATQTNEVGRLATLLPAFGRLAAGGPVSLVEVGASAGLCLYPDRWAYRWTTDDGVVEAGAGAGPLTCRVTGDAPLPAGPLVVTRRAGVDLHPLRVNDVDAMAWLEVLVWPEHDDRRALLREAIAVARADPPQIARGDLLAELPGLVAEAAAAGPVIVFHSAVIAYLGERDRRRFAELMAGLVASGACHWVSNEGPTVVPGLAQVGGASGSVPSGRFVLGIDGRAVAWTHGHGRELTWL